MEEDKVGEVCEWCGGFIRCMRNEGWCVIFVMLRILIENFCLIHFDLFCHRPPSRKYFQSVTNMKIRSESLEWHNFSKNNSCDADNIITNIQSLFVGDIAEQTKELVGSHEFFTHCQLCNAFSLFFFAL